MEKKEDYAEGAVFDEINREYKTMPKERVGGTPCRTQKKKTGKTSEATPSQITV